MERIKKCLAEILTLLFIIGCITITVNCNISDATNSDYKNGDSLSFGSYPQSLIIDEELIASLNSLPLLWKSYDYYISEDGVDGSMHPSDFMRFADVELNGERFRAVVFDSYRSHDTEYPSSLNGSNSDQDDNRYFPGNVYWFKFDPITWQVIDLSTGLVACTSIIDAQPYNSYIMSSGLDGHNRPAFWGSNEMNSYASKYSNSDLRIWLNTAFFDTAFSDLEKSEILFSTQDNRCTYSLQEQSGYEEYDSEQTVDKVFLLSYCDVQKGCLARKRLRGTDYAKCQGIYTLDPSVGGNDYSAWWTRSPVDSSSIYVVPDRYFDNGIQVVQVSTICGVCPAIKLQKIRHTFYATFLADGKQVGEKIPFTVETDNISPPDVPEKLGFVGAWPSYTLTLCDITVEAIYSPIEHSALFYVDGTIWDNQTVAYGDSICQPLIPQKDGFIFIGWSPDIPSSMPNCNMTFTAVFETVTYYATFMAEDETIERVPFTVEDERISVPDVPEKEGYVFNGWLPEIPETMPAKDMSFYAVFEKNIIPEESTNSEEPSVPAEPAKPNFSGFKIKNYSSTLSVDYKSTVIFHTTMDAPDGYEIVWSNNAKGSECKLNSITDKEYKVSAKMVNKTTGETEAVTEEVTVKVNTGFFAKLIAFFKGLFGSLPTYEDFKKK